MNMTHYMELLAVNQPWNLIIFMAIPVILAETLAITELYLLFTRKFEGAVYYLNKFSGIAVGIYFIGIIIYLITNAVIPALRRGEWIICDRFADSTRVYQGILGGVSVGKSCSYSEFIGAKGGWVVSQGRFITLEVVS